MSQRSQLYNLFCEGLHPRSGKGLSSTMTSTPLEDEDDDDDDSVGGQAPCIPAPAQPSVKESPSSSVQGQVGSAATDSPPGDDGIVSPACAALPKLSRPSKPDTEASSSTNVKEPKKSRTLAAALQKPSAEPSASQQSNLLKERNGNVSPVDFIDKLIAVKRRDEALGTRQKRRAVSPSSSETDFEGAEEYFKKCATSVSPSKPTEVESPVQSTRRSSKGTSDGSNINLVMESVSSSSSSDSSDASDSHPSPSAARCRILSKCQLNPKNKFGSDDNRGAQQVNAQIEGMNDVTEARSNTALRSTKSLTSAILKGVIAYVEVRSGHDNRSMGVKAQMRILGATVKEKFDKEVTHVVFNEGAPSTLNRAQIHGCCIVSVLWIEACKQEGRIVSEKDHPPLNLHLYDQKQTCQKSKYRRMKSLQPDFEEGKSEEILNKYVKKFRRQAQQAIASQHSGSSCSESSEDEGTNVSSPPVRPTCVIPAELKLKTLSVILKRIDAQDVNSTSITSETRKRKLMPIHQEIPASLSLEDFDDSDHVRPAFPYGAATCSKSKPGTHPRRIVKQIPSASQRRRSSCFVLVSQSSKRSQYPKKQVKSIMPTMVCTFMHRRDIDVVAAVIKQLGGWILEPTVSPRTTHVVCGDSKRTINLLRGIAHGCWILHQEWVMRSLEAGHWLDEEPYELTMFPAIQHNRVARETLGLRSEIFNSVGGIFVAKNTKPPRSDLLDLLELCGANIVKAPRQAKIIVGQHQKRASYSNVVLVEPLWVLDCIQENMLLPLRQYRL